MNSFETSLQGINLMNRIRRVCQPCFAAFLALILLSSVALAQVKRTPVLMVSIDGFRNDYLDRTDLYDAPNLRALAAQGGFSIHNFSQPLQHRHRPLSRT